MRMSFGGSNDRGAAGAKKKEITQVWAVRDEIPTKYHTADL